MSEYDPNTIEQLKVLAKQSVDIQIRENMVDLDRAIATNNQDMAALATRNLVSLEKEKEEVERRSDNYIARYEQAAYQARQQQNYAHPHELEVVKMVRQSRPDYTVEDYRNDCQRVYNARKFTHQGG
jgi:hypothetical protein